jgi:hypothetical protein
MHRNSGRGKIIIADRRHAHDGEEARPEERAPAAWREVEGTMKAWPFAGEFQNAAKPWKISRPVFFSSADSVCEAMRSQ